MTYQSVYNECSSPYIMVIFYCTKLSTLDVSKVYDGCFRILRLFSPSVDDIVNLSTFDNSHHIQPVDLGYF